MSGAIHQALVRLFETQPELLRTLVGSVLAAEGPATVRATDLTDLRPAERHADVVIALGEPPRLAVVLELQLSVDREKELAWPQYVVGVGTRLRCPTELVVLTLDDAVADWCRRPIRVSTGFVLRPIVVGPREIPGIEDPAAARGSPELAWLSALVRREDPDARRRVALAFDALAPRRDELSSILADTLLASLPDAVKEQVMSTGEYEFQSEFFREQIRRGRDEGRAEAVLLERRRTLRSILEARGLLLDSETLSRIEAESDPGRLQEWLLRAATATRLDEVFGD